MNCAAGTVQVPAAPLLERETASGTTITGDRYR